MPPKPIVNTKPTNSGKSTPVIPKSKYTPSYLTRTRKETTELRQLFNNSPDFENFVSDSTNLPIPQQSKVRHSPRLESDTAMADKGAIPKNTEASSLIDIADVDIHADAERVNRQLNAMQESDSVQNQALVHSINNQPISTRHDNSQLIEEIRRLKNRINELTMKPTTSKNSKPQSQNLASKSDEESLPRRTSNRRPNNHIRNHPHDSNQNGSSGSNSEPDSPNDNRFAGRRLPRNFRCEMDKWPIKFNGIGVQKFLKKLNRLQKSYDYDDITVAKYFHLLVEGRAANWFWLYCDENEDIDLGHMKIELAKAFRSEETDMTLLTRMYERKQNNDSFDTFFYDLLDINFSMKNPLSDIQVIEIMRANMDDEVRQRIFTYETKDRTKFYHKANSAYLDVCKIRQKQRPFYSNQRVNKKINEINFEDLSEAEIEEISTKVNHWQIKRATSKCFNCKSSDHLMRKCPVPITRIFCFCCGRENITYPQCPDCALNRKRSVEEARTSHS